METLTWLEALGLLGLVMVIATGKLLSPIRDWCLGFEKPHNVLRLFGELISCPMCTGVWVGFFWGWLAEGWPFWSAVILGGALSLVSLVVGIVLERLTSWATVAKKDAQAFGFADLVEAKLQERARRLLKGTHRDRMAEKKIAEGGDLTEEEAHAIADFNDREHDLWHEEIEEKAQEQEEMRQ